MASSWFELGRNIFNMQWLLGSITYYFLKFIFLVVIIGGIYRLFQIVTISMKLLKVNSDVRKGMGEHFADRLIAVWNDPIHYYKDGGIYSPELLVAD